MIARLFALCLALLAAPAFAGNVTVFAAASMKTALDEAAAAWAEGTGHSAVISYAGSSALARQIEAGAPAEIFISANPGWMDRLQDQGMVTPGTRVDLLTNRLVLIAHDPAAAPLNPADLPQALGEDRLAMALVDAVPAGIYGKAALTHLGLWGPLAPKVAQADNVRAALALVAVGEAPFGIVYATDAVAEPRVTVAATFPADSHPPIVYPAAEIDGAGPLAATFLAFLQGDTARAIFEAQGFAMAVRP